MKYEQFCNIFWVSYKNSRSLSKSSDDTKVTLLINQILISFSSFICTDLWAYGMNKVTVRNIVFYLMVIIYTTNSKIPSRIVREPPAIDYAIVKTFDVGIDRKTVVKYLFLP